MATHRRELSVTIGEVNCTQSDSKMVIHRLSRICRVCLLFSTIILLRMQHFVLIFFHCFLPSDVLQEA